MGPSCETFPVSWSHPGLTLGLHAVRLGQWVAGPVAARAGMVPGQEDGARPSQLSRSYTAGATGSSGSGRGWRRKEGWS